MSRILFFNIPAYGHTYPTLPLMAELAQRHALQRRISLSNLLINKRSRPGKSFGQPDGYVHDADEIQAFKRIQDIT